MNITNGQDPKPNKEFIQITKELAMFDQYVTAEYSLTNYPPNKYRRHTELQSDPEAKKEAVEADMLWGVEKDKIFRLAQKCLTDKQWHLFLFRFKFRLSQREVADQMKISLKTIGKRQQEIVTKLKREWKRCKGNPDNWTKGKPIYSKEALARKGRCCRRIAKQGKGKKKPLGFGKMIRKRMKLWWADPKNRKKRKKKYKKRNKTI